VITLERNPVTMSDKNRAGRAPAKQKDKVATDKVIKTHVLSSGIPDSVYYIRNEKAAVRMIKERLAFCDYEKLGDDKVARVIRRVLLNTYNQIQYYEDCLPRNKKLPARDAKVASEIDKVMRNWDWTGNLIE
jgi:hypothetical protein